MDEKAKSQGSFEDALMNELRFGGLDKDNLKELVTAIAGLQRNGLKRVKAFPKGIPVVDGLRVSGILDSSELSRFLGEMLLKTPRLTGVAVFPYGIPWPDIFRVNVDIGATSVNSNPMPGIGAF